MTESTELHPRELSVASATLSARDRTVIGVLLVATFVVILNETIMARGPAGTDDRPRRAAERGPVAHRGLPAHDVGDHPDHRVPDPPGPHPRPVRHGDGPVQRGHARRGAGAGVRRAARGPRRAGQRHGDHAAAADDHRDDPRAARPARRGHGQPLDRHLGGARRSGPPCPGSCCRSWAGGRVPGRAADRAGHAVDRAAPHGRHRRAHPLTDRRAVGRAVGRRVRRPRLRPERDRRGRRGRHAAHVGAVRRRRPRHRRVRRAPARAAAHRPRPAGPAHVPLAHVHHGVGDHDADDGHAAGLAHAAADLHAGGAAPQPARHRPAAAAGRPGHGPARAGGRAPVRPARRARAAGARHRRHQPGAVVEHAVRRREPGLVVLGFHVLLSVGLAFVFTPLFTAGLGAVEPRLYSYGSAIFGTTQQLAGAAGRRAAGQRAQRRRGRAHGRGRHAGGRDRGRGARRRSSWPRCSPSLAIVAALGMRTPARRRSRSRHCQRPCDGAGWARDVDGRRACPRWSRPRPTCRPRRRSCGRRCGSSSPPNARPGPGRRGRTCGSRAGTSGSPRSWAAAAGWA